MRNKNGWRGILSKNISYQTNERDNLRVIIMYVCMNCGEKINIKKMVGVILCPKCSGKILFKQAPPITKRISCD
jgi:DNA-directed RNA polymerase subunit RPC12/RpoP